jgi:ABC-2 type transport system permease protein
MKNINLLLIIGLIVLLNLFGNSIFSRIDLTKENRYSLSDLTTESMERLQGPAFAEVYLEGEFPAQIRRYQEVLRTTLLEYQQYAGEGFDFEFMNPGDNPNLRQELGQRGISPIPVKVRKGEFEQEEKLMFPVVVLRYGEREQYIDLLKGCAFPNGEINFLKAEADLEYKLTSAFRNLSRERQGLIAVLQGQGEHLMEPEIEWERSLQGDSIPRVKRVKTEMSEFLSALDNAYTVANLDLSQTPDGAISPSIDVLMILQPSKPFSERVKYEIDQYLMRGGNILWVLDQQQVDLDLYEKRSTLTQLRELNLDDMFMNYGFKVNYDLVQDLSCEPTEVFNTQSQQFSERPWIFYPRLFVLPEHPVNRNVDAVLLRYASSIDTFPQQGVQKSVFLQSSPYSRTVQGTQFIDLNQYLQNPPPKALFNKGPQVMGLMLEGTFGSLFQGREAPQDSAFPFAPAATFLGRSDLAEQMVAGLKARDSSLKDQRLARYLERVGSGKGRRMAVISEGEFVLPKLFRGKRQFLPYDNKSLLLNVVDYLAGT